MMASLPSDKAYKMYSFTDLITNSFVCLDNGSQTNMMKYKEKEI